MALDLGSFESVKAFAEAFTKKYGRLHLLINNAGIFDMAASSRVTTADGYESHIQVWGSGSD